MFVTRGRVNLDVGVLAAHLAPVAGIKDDIQLSRPVKQTQLGVKSAVAYANILINN